MKYKYLIFILFIIIFVFLIIRIFNEATINYSNREQNNETVYSFIHLEKSLNSFFVTKGLSSKKFLFPPVFNSKKLFITIPGGYCKDCLEKTIINPIKTIFNKQKTENVYFLIGQQSTRDIFIMIKKAGFSNNSIIFDYENNFFSKINTNEPILFTLKSNSDFFCNSLSKTMKKSLDIVLKYKITCFP